MEILINWSKYFQRIPAQVKIGKSIYEICWVQEFFRDKEQLGETRFDGDKQIIIKIEQSIKEAVMTYWHEVCHAISHEYNIGLTEKQVQKLEKSLPNIIDDGNLFMKVSKDETNKRIRRNSKRIRKVSKKIR